MLHMVGLETGIKRVTKESCKNEQWGKRSKQPYAKVKISKFPFCESDAWFKY